MYIVDEVPTRVQWVPTSYILNILIYFIPVIMTNTSVIGKDKNKGTYSKYNWISILYTVINHIN